MISVSEMREVEKKADEMGIEDRILMENAGANAAKAMDGTIGLKGKEVLVFCGTGNNAGDGLVFARHALIFGAEAKIYFVKGKEFLKPLPMKNYAILKNLRRGGHNIEFYEKLDPDMKADILIDAMLGTGIKRDVEKEYEKAIRLYNSMRGLKVSMDCPSGIDADTGKVMGCAVRPDVTVTFYDRKPGLDEENSGRITVVGIGIPKM